MKEYKIKINGNDYNVTIDEVEGNAAKVEVNGTPYNVEFDKPLSKPKTISVVNRPAAAPAAGPAPASRPAAAPAAAPSTLRTKSTERIRATTWAAGSESPRTN